MAIIWLSNYLFYLKFKILILLLFFKSVLSFYHSYDTQRIFCLVDKTVWVKYILIKYCFGVFSKENSSSGKINQGGRVFDGVLLDKVCRLDNQKKKKNENQKSLLNILDYEKGVEWKRRTEHASCHFLSKSSSPAWIMKTWSATRPVFVRVCLPFPAPPPRWFLRKEFIDSIPFP